MPLQGKWAVGPPKIPGFSAAECALESFIDCFESAGYDRESTRIAMLKMHRSKNFQELGCILDSIMAARSSWGLAHWAAQAGLDNFSLLLELGEDICKCDEDGHTPMHVAASAGQSAVLRSLLLARADVEARDAEHGTAAHKAAAANQDKALRVLADLGADLAAKDQWGGTPAHAAAANGACISLLCLSSLGVMMMDIDSTGQTPAHWAAEGGATAALETLADLGAALDHKDYQDQTPYDIAVENNHMQAAHLLAGPKTNSTGPLDRTAFPFRD
mmetsp:Transcript_87505/g.155204  ORF Transcript_87505/g.155204 Transcript_87505/m.155204 type:complete len:274 (+) Transcript_87505:27-848(+)